MASRTADKIRVRWYELEDRYERLAREFHRILDGDTVFPSEAVYTVKHRLKSHPRLLEKIEHENAQSRKKSDIIGPANFESRIDDLLGLRIVCLRLSDLNKLKEYLASLKAERKLRFVRGPIEKKTFLIRPGDADGSREHETDIQYSGYSSIHYVATLGHSLRPAADIADLRAELQLRTIFEEAWGEIDHKYRYELTRVGKSLPTHVDTGFRDLGLYLQAAARQADHLCEEVQKLMPSGHEPARKRLGKQSTKKRRALASPKSSAATALEPPVTTIPAILKSLLGFEPTPRTLSYILRRMDEHADFQRREFTITDLHNALSPTIVGRFREIYTEVMRHPPFEGGEVYDRDLDVVPLVNFAIFSRAQSRETAEAGLRATLRNRLLQRGQ